MKTTPADTGVLLLEGNMYAGKMVRFVRPLFYLYGRMLPPGRICGQTPWF